MFEYYYYRLWQMFNLLWCSCVIEIKCILSLNMVTCRDLYLDNPESLSLAKTTLIYSAKTYKELLFQVRYYVTSHCCSVDAYVTRICFVLLGQDWKNITRNSMFSPLLHHKRRQWWHFATLYTSKDIHKCQNIGRIITENRW